jgi:predicted nucleic acid-binding protein
MAEGQGWLLGWLARLLLALAAGRSTGLGWWHRQRKRWCVEIPHAEHYSLGADGAEQPEGLRLPDALVVATAQEHEGELLTYDDSLTRTARKSHKH